jgi:DNA-directed RNA polymerase
MDFRGRIYPVVNYLNYQGGDIARSLLNFHITDTKISRNDHILIYLSNVFGIGNAKTMSTRIK